MDTETDIDLEGSLEVPEPSTEVLAVESDGDEELSLRDIIKNAAAGKEAPEGETAEERKERLRDEKGRFLPGDKAPADKASTDLTVQGETATDEQPAETPGVLEVPRSWAAEDADAFRALPPETQRRVAEKESKRDALFSQGHQQLKEAIAMNRGIGSAIQPYVQDWKLRGVDPVAAVDRLIAFDEMARKDLPAAIRWLAAENDFDLHQLTVGQPQVSPQQRAYDERIARLESELEETRRGFTTQAHQQTVGFVNSWGSEKDASGNALRPHFESVREDMSAFVPALEQKYPNATPQELLDRAYRLALADRPDLQKVEQQSVEQKRIADAKAKAERARKASSSIPSSFNGNSQVVPDDLRSVIVAAVNQHRA